MNSEKDLIKEAYESTKDKNWADIDDAEIKYSININAKCTNPNH
jgi:hypothetical protein